MFYKFHENLVVYDCVVVVAVVVVVVVGVVVVVVLVVLVVVVVVFYAMIVPIQFRSSSFSWAFCASAAFLAACSCDVSLPSASVDR